MKVRIISLIMIGVLFMCTSGYAQMAASAAQKKNTSGSIPFGLGATFIDGETYYLVNLAPEVAFGDLGIGLDLNLRFSSSGKLRAEYKKFEDYLRIIRYVRWAQKGDPFYIRLGQLDYAQLGHGFILYNYRNTASYDLRKTGMELDLNFEKFGFESVLSDFAHAGVLGLRGYVKPLKFTSLESVPVINNFEVGATFASDMNKDANKTYDAVNNKVVDNGALSVIGFDLGLPVLSYKIIKSTLYFDYAKILDYGSGSAVGIDLRFAGLGLLTINAKYERRWNGDQFLPAYFNAMYERERYIDSLRTKVQMLKAVKANEGYYGELWLSVLNTFNVIGAYQAPVGVRNAGIFHAELDVDDVIPSIVIGGGFDKVKVGKVFKLDENSILYAQVGYKPVPYLVVSTLYQWTWTKDEATGAYKTQRRIEPKVSLVFNF